MDQGQVLNKGGIQLHIEMIKKANHYIRDQKENVNQQYRNHYHLMGETGWINDPNGFVYYQGEYHLFYQYYPYDSVWGPMHWGHAKSKDLVHWEPLPVALAPSEQYDKNGCFSGSAIVKDEKLYLMYTGHVEEGDFRREVQCIAVSTDGIHFEKHQNNPVIAEEHIAGIAQVDEFRDPKIFSHDDTYYSVVVAQTPDKRGQVLLFKSENLLQWDFVSVLLEGKPHQGVMWECPDFFHLDGKDVLILSPIQMEANGHEYRNTSSTIAFIGKMDWTTGQLSVENEHEIDGGLDFYAPQTCMGPNGERMMVAWMQMWQRDMPTHILNHSWAGSMTLPRELTILENRLVQRPPQAIYANILEKKVLTNHSLKQPLILRNQVTNHQYLKFVFNQTQTKEILIDYPKGEKERLSIRYLKETGELTLSRRFMGDPINGIEKPHLDERTIICDNQQEEFVLEIFRDTSSIELFVNNGHTMTFTFYEKELCRDLVVNATGECSLKYLEISNIE